jgi:hypothetical protein
MRYLWLTPLFACGCLAAQLHGPAQDHHVQTRIIEERCKAGEYDYCAPELIEDLEAMREQACLIEAITRRESGEECGSSSSE